MAPSRGSRCSSQTRHEGPAHGTGHGWTELGEKDFAKVNSKDDPWAWRDGVLYCTGKPTRISEAL